MCSALIWRGVAARVFGADVGVSLYFTGTISTCVFSVRGYLWIEVFWKFSKRVSTVLFGYNSRNVAGCDKRILRCVG